MDNLREVARRARGDTSDGGGLSDGGAASKRVSGQFLAAQRHLVGVNVVVLLVALLVAHGAALQDDPNGLAVKLVVLHGTLDRLALELSLALLANLAGLDFLDHALQGLHVDVHVRTIAEFRQIMSRTAGSMGDQ